MEKFDNFAHIEHVPLRVYNRAITILNIKTDLGADAMKEYVSQFNEQEMKQVGIMLAYMSKYGKKKAMEECTAGIEFTDDQVAA